MKWFYKNVRTSSYWWT